MATGDEPAYAPVRTSAEKRGCAVRCRARTESTSEKLPACAAKTAI